MRPYTGEQLEEILDSEALGTQYVLQRGAHWVCFSSLKFTLKNGKVVFISSFYFLSNILGRESMVWSGTLSEVAHGFHMCAHSPVVSVDPRLLKVRSCTHVMETFAFGSVEYRRVFSVCLRTLCVYILFLQNIVRRKFCFHAKSEHFDLCIR